MSDKLTQFLEPSEYIPACFSNTVNEAKKALALGIDLSLLEENLKRSHEERILLHEDTLQAVLELKAAGEFLRR